MRLDTEIKMLETYQEDRFQANLELKRTLKLQKNEFVCPNCYFIHDIDDFKRMRLSQFKMKCERCEEKLSVRTTGEPACVIDKRIKFGEIEKGELYECGCGKKYSNRKDAINHYSKCKKK